MAEAHVCQESRETVEVPADWLCWDAKWHSVPGRAPSAPGVGMQGISMQDNSEAPSISLMCFYCYSCSVQLPTHEMIPFWLLKLANAVCQLQMGLQHQLWEKELRNAVGRG